MEDKIVITIEDKTQGVSRSFEVVATYNDKEREELTGLSMNLDWEHAPELSEMGIALSHMVATNVKDALLTLQDIPGAELQYEKKVKQE